MSEPIKIAIIGLIGAVMGAIITGVIGWKQYELQHEQFELQRAHLEKAENERNLARAEVGRYRRAYEDAPGKFTRKLGELISRSAEEGQRKEGPPNLEVNARAIVSARDGLRSTLDTLGARLNSDIDELAKESSKPQPDPAKLRELIEVLDRKWPLKKEEIGQAVKNVTTQLGLVIEAGEQDKAAEPKESGRPETPMGAKGGGMTR